MFKLTKLSIDEGKRSAVRVGYSTKAETAYNFHHTDTKKSKKIEDLNDIEEGLQVVLLNSFFDYHNTSEISKIIERSDNKVIFKTQTSTYELTKSD